MNSPLQRMRRDSSLAKGARGWGGGPQMKKREIPLFATRRTKAVRRKKPGRFVRNDDWGWVVRGTQASRPGLNCDTPPALRADGEMNSPLQRMGKRDAHFSTDLPLTSAASPFV